MAWRASVWQQSHTRGAAKPGCGACFKYSSNLFIIIFDDYQAFSSGQSLDLPFGSPLACFGPSIQCLGQSPHTRQHHILV